MTMLDTIVALLALGFGVGGLMRGFVAEALAVAAWLAAFVVTRLIHAPVTAMLSGLISTPGGAAVIALVLIFGGVLILGRLLARQVGQATLSSSLGPVDRVLGLGFGVAKGLLIATVLYMIVSLVFTTIYGGRSSRPEWMKEARTAPLLDAISGAIIDFVEERGSA